jgi:hypothetical protein
MLLGVNMVLQPASEIKQLLVAQLGEANYKADSPFRSQRMEAATHRQL